MLPFINKEKFTELLWSIIISDLIADVKDVNHYLGDEAVYFAMARMGVIGGKIVVEYRVIAYVTNDEYWEKMKKAYSTCVDRFMVTEKGVKYRMVGEELNRLCEEMMMKYEILAMNINFLRKTLGLEDEITSIKITGRIKLVPKHRVWLAEIRLELTSRVLEKNAKIVIKPVVIVKPNGEITENPSYRFPKITKIFLTTMERWKQRASF